ncbi:four helix bundle protein [Akkermansiaceae bacterium]|nr:four helix bundle protein [Akkermansiaceae bacterium]
MSEDGGQNSTTTLMAGSQIHSAKELQVYQLAYELSMEVFHLSKSFALTSQIRRSSRSVTLNLREAWAKRRYEAHFISKITDCDGENSETDSSLDFAKDCGYITPERHQTLTDKNRSIGRMLGAMLKQPEKWLPKSSSDSQRSSLIRNPNLVSPINTRRGLPNIPTYRLEMASQGIQRLGE